MHIAQVVEQLRSGGYYERVMAGGRELDRMKEFLRACAGELTVAPANPLQRPHYPLFPGLGNRPWHDAREYEAARILESHFGAIRDEAAALGHHAPLDYSKAATRDAPAQSWTVFPLYHMGVGVEAPFGRCPSTLAIVDSLPGACIEYPWGDFVFSAMGPGAHLRPHCSQDNLRVRLHLGITIPVGCSIRVDREIRGWREGECLAFEDSFEHEVWNRSERRRVVLIADLWHPDLTAIEVRALTAAFRKSEVRRVFMGERIGMTDAPQRYLPQIEAALACQDRDLVVREFWPD